MLVVSGWTVQSVHVEVSVSTDKLSPVSLTPASIQTALMGKIDISFFFLFSSSATKVTAESRKTSGGQMMSFFDKLTAYLPTEGPCHRFYLDLSTHLPSLLTALSNKWRRKKEMNKQSSDLISFDWKQSVFGAVTHPSF